jgi:anaerobic selenocysteine-containing dehydrogenase
LIHPETAQKYNLTDKKDAKISSRVGSVILPVEITDEIMPNVVSIPHGYGHYKKGSKLDIAQKHAGASINDLTDELLTDKLTGNAAFSGVPVSLECI